MKVQEAVVKRIRNLCREKNMNMSQLAYCAGMPQSTLKNVMNGNSKNTGIVTIMNFFSADYLRYWNRKLIKKYIVRNL